MEHPSLNSLIPLYLKAVYRAFDSRTAAWHELTFDQSLTAISDDPAALPFTQPWTIITAWNPMSQPLPDADNHAAQARLLDAIQKLGLPHHQAEAFELPAETHSPPAWREESLLVERIEWKEAVQLIKVFRQGAAVYAASGKVGLLFAEPERWDPYPIRIHSAPTIPRP